MYIHTNLYRTDLHAAARRAGVSFVRLTTHGSRRSERAFDVILKGSGNTGGQWGNTGGYGASAVKAATWDEWGIFLDLLYRRDPDTFTYAYSNRDHFEWATGNRYDSLMPEDQHIRHKWNHDGVFGRNYSVQRCGCGALRRFIVRGNWRPEYVNDFALIHGDDTLYDDEAERFGDPFAGLAAAEPWVPRVRVS